MYSCKHSKDNRRNQHWKRIDENWQLNKARKQRLIAQNQRLYTIEAKNNKANSTFKDSTSNYIVNLDLPQLVLFIYLRDKQTSFHKSSIIKSKLDQRLYLALMVQGQVEIT